MQIALLHLNQHFRCVGRSGIRQIDFKLVVRWSLDVDNTDIQSCCSNMRLCHTVNVTMSADLCVI